MRRRSCPWQLAVLALLASCSIRVGFERPTRTGDSDGAEGDCDQGGDAFNLLLCDDQPCLAINDVSAVEGQDAQFVVSLNRAVATEVRVGWTTADDTASAPTDYQAGSGVLVIPPQTIAAVLPVAVVSDGLTEPIERFEVVLHGAAGALISDYRGVASIRDPFNATKLNGPMTALGGGVSQFVLTADGNRIVYASDGETSGAAKLYRANRDGSDTVNLTPNLDPWAAVSQIRLTPDNSRAVFYSNHGSLLSRWSLFSVPLAGGDVTRLTPEPPEGNRWISTWSITPDSEWVVFVFNLEDSARQEIFAARVDGSVWNKLNRPVTSGVSTSFLMAPSVNGARVIYRAYEEGAAELHAVAPDGTSRTKLSGPLVSGSAVQENSYALGYALSGDATRVFYRADAESTYTYELYSVALDGSGSSKVNGPLNNSWGDVHQFHPVPGGTRVLYSAMQERNGYVELYVANADGSNRVKLSGDLPNGGSVLYTFVPTADGQRVVYVADQITDNLFELFSTRLDGTGNVKLNGPLAGNQTIRDFQVSPDSLKVVFRGEVDAVGVTEIYAVHVDGSGLAKLNGPLAGGGTQSDPKGVQSFAITPDSGRVVYLAYEGSSSTAELYSVRLDGTGRVKLNAALPAGGKITTDYRTSLDSSTVLYLADQQTAHLQELFSAPAGGGAAPSRVSFSCNPIGGDVVSFVLLPNQSGVVYLADQISDSSYNIFLSALDGSINTLVNPGFGMVHSWSLSLNSSPDSALIAYTGSLDTTDYRYLYVSRTDGTQTLRLNPPFAMTYGSVGGFAFTPDSSQIVFLSDQETYEEELFVINVDGTGYTKLNSVFASSTCKVSTFEIMKTGTTVIYLSDELELYTRQVFSVGLDGTNRVVLNGPLVNRGSVSWFRSSPDQTFLVYTADQLRDGQVELFRVQLDGTNNLKLSGTLPTTGGVSSFLLSPDGQRFACLASTDTQWLEPDLYAGDTAATGWVLLNPPLVAHGRIWDYAFTADSSWIVLFGDLETDNVVEFYATRPDGTEWHKLTRPSMSPGGSLPHVVATLSSRIYYLAAEDTANVSEVYGIGLDGTDRVKINSPLVVGGSVSSFRLTPDETQIVYVADQDTDQTWELYVAPAHGGGPSLKLNPPLPPGGSVGSFTIHPNAGIVIYSADQHVDNVTELYAVPLPTP